MAVAPAVGVAVTLEDHGPPLRTRADPWKYHREIYERRYEIKRQFRRLRGFRRIFSRIEKPDARFLGFILFVFALIFDTLRWY